MLKWREIDDDCMNFHQSSFHREIKTMILQAKLCLEGRNGKILQWTRFLINKSKHNECVTGIGEKGSHALNC